MNEFIETASFFNARHRLFLDKTHLLQVFFTNATYNEHFSPLHFLFSLLKFSREDTFLILSGVKFQIRGLLYVTVSLPNLFFFCKKSKVTGKVFDVIDVASYFENIVHYPVKRQFHKMVKHTQTIRR